jgi:hypothetical protein
LCARYDDEPGETFHIISIMHIMCILCINI